MTAGKNIRKQVLSNPIMATALLTILLAAIFSVFAYIIIEDNSPNSNNQLPEISLKPPGFSTKALLLNNNIDIAKQTFFQRLFSGKEKPFYEQPFKELKEGNGLIEILTHFDQIKYIAYKDLYHYENKTSLPVTEKYFLLGTDKYGRSIASRLLLGVRISLAVGFLAVVISITIGIALGAIGGYFGGWIDQLVLYLINVTWSIPTLLLVFAIVLAFGRGIGIIFLAVGLTMWVDVARIVRGQVKKTKEDEYVTAARSLGYNSGRIIFHHILPNIIGPILVIAAANFATAILLEAGLSYLGFGIKPPAPSIGNMLNENYGYALSNKPFLAIIPAITIMLLVLSFNLVGSGLRDIFDVKENNT